MTTADELEQLCKDGEAIDELVKRFQERCNAGYKGFASTLVGLMDAQAALSKRMNGAIDAVEKIAVSEAGH